MNDHKFFSLLKHADEPFVGWDFSFITDTGRMTSGLFSWSYGSMALSLIQDATSMLDMGTGGGEFLSKLGPFPPSAYATESYLPNVPVAKERLTPLGVQVVQVDNNEALPFIEDDIYRELWIDQAPPPPIKSMDQNGHVLYIGSFSKTLSPGLRIGWIVGPEPVVERLSDIKMQTDYGSSSLSQRVAAEWLTTGHYQKHLENVREQLKKRRDFVLEVLEEHLKGLASWNMPKGGFFIWLNILPPLSMKSLYAKALAEGILLNSGSIYAQENGNFIRLSYAFASPGDLKKGIYQLSLIIKTLATESGKK
ncbi:SAM methytransferase [Bacillus glycinifermentans]|uniref:Aminotransferase class I/II-fold pyridoxal phosphate-dependent enzyme n=1 Tax=Bacillus glycinifermentans TaxID=1664069 RepID=A0AAJ3YVU3_9BACI|nr:aminotransferase class I/II-fold pyridoxal phosphate-dependent enzyme [Bacillus glycinifermentans]SCA84583.1 SAM methytransferase [Bacillus glycinifermentans]